MANDSNPSLEVLIKSVLSSEGFDNLKARLREAAEQTKAQSDAQSDAARTGGLYSDVISDITTRLVGAVGVIELASKSLEFLKESFTAAVEESRVLDQMTVSTNTVAGATVTSTAAMKAWIESLEAASGKTKEELAPAYIKLVSATNDVTTAQDLTQIAAGAASRGLGELSRNSQILAQWFETGKVRATGIGAAIHQLSNEGKSNDEIVQVLFKRYGDGGKSIENAGIQVDRAKVKWADTKAVFGELAIGLAEKLAPALKLIAEGFVGAKTVIELIFVPVRSLGMALGQIGAAIYHLATGQWKTAWGDIKDIATKNGKMVEDIFTRNAELMEKVENVWSTSADKINTSTKGMKGPVVQHKDALKELEAEYRKLLDEAQTSVGGQEAILKAEIAVYHKLVDDERATDVMRADGKKKLYAAIMELIGLRAKAEAESQKEITRLGDDEEKAFLKRETDKQNQFKKNWAERIKLATLETKARSKSETDLEKVLAGLYDQEAQDYHLSEDARTEAAEKGSDIRRKVAQQELANQKEIANGLIALAGDVFGQSKELSIATALINTYQGVTGALSMQPWTYMNIVMAALVLAQGLAQVANIESTNGPSTGSGFDDPRNDFAAYVGGQKWARDMVDHYSAGAAAGFASQITNDNRQYHTSSSSKQGDRHSHFNIHGVGLIDSSSDVMLRRFVRRLQAVERVEGNRTLR